MARNFHLERYPGKHVAIDMATDEVVLAADTPYELEAQIRSQGLRNVAVMRAPRGELIVRPPAGTRSLRSTAEDR